MSDNRQTQSRSSHIGFTMGILILLFVVFAFLPGMYQDSRGGIPAAGIEDSNTVAPTAASSEAAAPEAATPVEAAAEPAVSTQPSAVPEAPAAEPAPTVTSPAPAAPVSNP